MLRMEYLTEKLRWEVWLLSGRKVWSSRQQSTTFKIDRFCTILIVREFFGHITNVEYDTTYHAPSTEIEQSLQLPPPSSQSNLVKMKCDSQTAQSSKTSTVHISEFSSFSGSSGKVYTPVNTTPSNTSGGILEATFMFSNPMSAEVGVPVLTSVSSVKFLW